MVIILKKTDHINNVLVTIELTAKLEEHYEFEPDVELKTNKLFI